MDGSDNQSVVDDIRTLHALMTPTDVIARTLHLREQTVRHVIKTGTLPPEQLLLRWKTET